MVVLAAIALIARARWSEGTACLICQTKGQSTCLPAQLLGYAGLQKLPTGDGRFPCKAAGGPDRLLQLGNLNGFQHAINTRSKLAQQLFNVVRVPYSI